jgi:superoxide dismutase, Fe-Mn family
MSITLPALPFSMTALATKGMCQETVELHHDKHHQTYVTTLNGLIEKDAALKGKSLQQLVELAHGKQELAAVFNNAGQVWNHNLFWESLSPSGGGIPGTLEKQLTEDFGSVAKFKDAFKAAAVGQFASGWAWLVLGKDGKLKITKTSNASSPLATDEGTALLVLDVWEHAYYLDYRNRRPEFVDNFIGKLANCEAVTEKLKKA